MIALTIVGIILTASAFIFCTIVGIKAVMENYLPGIGLCCIAMGLGNLLLCIGNIMRLLFQCSGT